MNFTKLRIIFSIIFVMFIFTANLICVDSVKMPRDTGTNEVIQSIDFVGSKVSVKAMTTAQQAITTTGSDIAGVCYGVILSSGSASAYVVLYDSCTSGSTSGTQITPRLYYNGTSTTSQVITFPVPIQFTYGLTILGSEASTTNSAAILYRAKTDN